MPNARIQRLTANLPSSLRRSVDGYVEAVSAALPEIERDSGVRIRDNRITEFLMIVAIRRIWAAVNNQYWIMDNCIRLSSRLATTSAETGEMRGFRVGRDEISAGSAAYLESSQLLADFDRLISQLGIEDIVSKSASLSEIAKQMFNKTE